MRFRPIMMTTMAALAGTLPIALGIGAGAESRRPLGLAVVGGLLVSQTLTLYLTPVFYTYMEGLSGLLSRRRAVDVAFERPSEGGAPARGRRGSLPSSGLQIGAMSRVFAAFCAALAFAAAFSIDVESDAVRARNRSRRVSTVRRGRIGRGRAATILLVRPR